MTDSADTGITSDHVPDYAAGNYTGGRQRPKIRRVKLGLLLASLAACLSVTLIGVVGNAVIYMAAELGGFERHLDYATGFAGGAYIGIQLATFNFILFFITVPAAWIAMGLSIGQFPRRGITGRKPYLRWAAIWGTLLVGGTTGFFGAMIAGPFAGAGALLSGALIGGIAGLLCGMLFHAIVKPAEQLHAADVSVF